METTKRLGFLNRAVRLNIGLEDTEDLIVDLRQALEQTVGGDDKR